VHLVAALIVVLIAIRTPAQYIHTAGATIFILLLVYQHLLVKPNDLSKVNLAFFTSNGIASVVYGTLVIIDLWV
jgi:4-hydroxybenzoate polyprenyltransferase